MRARDHGTGRHTDSHGEVRVTDEISVPGIEDAARLAGWLRQAGVTRRRRARRDRADRGRPVKPDLPPRSGHVAPGAAPAAAGPCAADRPRYGQGVPGALGAGRHRHPGAAAGGDLPGRQRYRGAVLSHGVRRRRGAAQCRGRSAAGARPGTAAVRAADRDAGRDPRRGPGGGRPDRFRPSGGLPGQAAGPLAAAVGIVIDQGGARLTTSWSPGWRRDCRKRARARWCTATSGSTTCW